MLKVSANNENSNVIMSLAARILIINKKKKNSEWRTTKNNTITEIAQKSSNQKSLSVLYLTIRQI